MKTTSKQIKSASLAILGMLAMAAGTAWSAGPPDGGRHFFRGRPPVQAPEIDAGAGGNALALLVGGVLLAAERARSKRSP
jgi:hypothetical protein